MNSVAELLAASEALRQATSSKLTKVPRTFIEFCRACDVVLTPGQAELSRVAFDGALPVDRGLASSLFGDVAMPLGVRRVVAAVCGARAGKTYVLVALRLVWGMLVRHLPPLPPGAEAGALILAPRDRMRMEAYRYAVGVVMAVPWLASMLVGEPRVDSFTLRRPSDGKDVELVCGVATAGGTAARAKWWTDFALDECCFFRDDTSKVNDKEIFRAAFARLLPGGQGILASTPWAEAGLLYEYWKKRPAEAAVIHAPTLTLHDTDVTRSVVDSARAQDPDNAEREFDAKFMTTGTTVFFEGASLDAALTDEPFELQPGDSVAAGVDLAFVGDSSALVMAAMRGDTLHIFDGREERPANGMPLNPETTIASFVNAIVGRCSYVMADRHYWLTLATECSDKGLSCLPAPTVPAETYVRTRQLLRAKRIKIHPLEFRERLLQQMREVQGRPTPGGGMSIIHPRWSQGGHGDICAALVLAAWQVTGEVVPKPKPEENSAEAEMARKRARFEQYQAEENRPHWRARGGAADRGRDAYWRRS